MVSLYHRIGGYDVIAAVIEDLFNSLRADPAFARFASGRSLDSQARAQQLLVEQMCALSGGPCRYLGCGEAEKAEFLELFERYRLDIVEA